MSGGSFSEQHLDCLQNTRVCSSFIYGFSSLMCCTFDLELSPFRYRFPRLRNPKVQPYEITDWSSINIHVPSSGGLIWTNYYISTEVARNLEAELSCGQKLGGWTKLNSLNGEPKTGKVAGEFWDTFRLIIS